MIKNVLVRAPLLTNSGYGVHSRQIFEWLDSRKDFNITTQPLAWGATPWIVNPSKDDGIFGKIMNSSRQINGKFDITFQVQLPDEWDESLGRINIGVTALVETDKCNPMWFSKIDKMDQVIVPSSFTKDIIIETFGSRFDKKVHVIPEWFNTKLLEKKNVLSSYMDKRYKFDTKFNLLTIGTLTALESNCDRKNLVNTIRWAIEEFEGQKDVGIIVKTCLGKGSKKDREMTISAIKQIVSSFRKSDFPKIHLIHGNMSSYEIAALFKSNIVSGYISATRGEGYGLPLIEAAASEIPIVTTGWSGHLDFLNNSFLDVDYNLTQIPNNRIDNRIFMPGARWAEPIESSFKERLRDLKENYEDHCKNSKKLKKFVINRFSKEKICKKYDKFLKENCNL